MAATPQAERRAARVPINSASRLQNSSSEGITWMPKVRSKRSRVSDRFSKGSSSMNARKEESRE